jgi:hypothetical protein
MLPQRFLVIFFYSLKRKNPGRAGIQRLNYDNFYYLNFPLNSFLNLSKSGIETFLT